MTKLVSIVFSCTLLLATTVGIAGCSLSPKASPPSEAYSSKTHSSAEPTDNRLSDNQPSDNKPSDNKLSDKESPLTDASETAPETRLPSAADPQGDKTVPDPQQMMSAEVLLTSATGATFDGNTVITAENIQDYAPAPEAAAAVSQYFESQGFEVSPLGGISFTISAPSDRFSEFFATDTTSNDIATRSTNAESESSELPLDSIEESVKGLIKTVTLVRSPDFGPTNFSY